MRKYTPIRVGNKVIGKVHGETFIKRIQGSRHFLNTPPAIALDMGSLAQAEKAGAHRVQVIDTESGAIYRASIDLIRRKGFVLDRGFGRQLALPLDDWACTCRGELEQLSLL